MRLVGALIGLAGAAWIVWSFVTPNGRRLERARPLGTVLITANLILFEGSLFWRSLGFALLAGLCLLQLSELVDVDERMRSIQEHTDKALALMQRLNDTMRRS